MDTPVYDFVRRYADSGIARFHMPGHKGRPFLGCEPLDITEISGADALYEASGILGQSEANAAALFGSGKTLFATEGSSQCIRAMVSLAVANRPPGTAPLLVAARNAHKSFLYAAALSGAEIVWLWPETEAGLCACPVSPERLERTLDELPAPPAAVFLTSPDYLGGQLDLAALAAVCRVRHTPLLVDNAHGAYLHFLDPNSHPLDLGADLCCDSAHKTLPVLTGGAYLHIGKSARRVFREGAKSAMALFGSTSPSYLTLASLDLCNRYLAEGYAERLANTVSRLEALRTRLRARGWTVEKSDPLRLTLRENGGRVAEKLRKNGVEWEYADRDYMVLMVTPENTPEELERLERALGKRDFPVSLPETLPFGRGDPVLTPGEALFAPSEFVAVERSLGRICADPAVSCPPAIPIAVSGERIGPEAVALFRRYGIREVAVVRE